MKRRKGKIVVAVVAALLLAGAVFVFLNLPKPLTAKDSAYDLSQLADGVYTGSCDNGIVQAQVEVAVQSHSIAGVRIVKHQNGLGGPAEAITEDIVKRQSVELDAVSGATMSSKTILKAVENALSGMGK